MSFAGNFKTVSFGDALQLISTGKKTGAFHLERAKRSKKIFFRGGNIIAALSDPPTDEERLGQLLLRRGEITPDVLDRALKRQRSTKRRLGQVLIDMDLLARDKLMNVLRAQVEEVVYAVFGWTDGEFHFVEAEEPGPSQILVDLNTLNVMMEGARRFDEYAQIAHALPSEDAVLRHILTPRITNGEITLTSEDLEVLVAIDGERTVGEIVGHSMHGEYAASKALHKVLSASLAEPCPQKSETARQRADEGDVFNLIYQVYSRALEAARQILADQLGAAGDRLFMRIPESCEDDARGMSHMLVDRGGNGGVAAFRDLAAQIPDAVRLHRVLDVSGRTLRHAIDSVRDRLGSHRANQLVRHIEQDLMLVLGQKRDIADNYDIRRELNFALRGDAS